MSGDEKLPALVIGKSKKPRCFKNVKTLPVKYQNNKRSWMTGLLFEEWLRSINEKFKKEERKVCLFIDNCPAHPKVQLSNIKLVFFPSNCTSKLQPCDQGIIANFKQTACVAQNHCGDRQSNGKLCACGRLYRVVSLHTA